jgi:adenylate kinase family enzyme
MRVALIGNSGSGKTTLARWLATRAGAAMLDLDTMAGASAACQKGCVPDSLRVP